MRTKIIQARAALSQKLGNPATKAAWLKAQKAIGWLISGAGLVWSLWIVAGAFAAQGLEPLRNVMHGGGLFWLCFVLSVLAEPLVFCAMLHRIFASGWSAFVPLVQRQAYNSLLFPYAGDAYFTAFLEKHKGSLRSAMGFAGDMAITSAATNNLFTVLLVALTWNQFEPLIGQYWGYAAAASLLAFIIIPLGLGAFRHRHMQGQAALLYAAMLGRTLVFCVFLALSWHFLLPELSWSLLALLITARMAVCRLPFVPNKDIAFAASVILFAGPEARIGAALSALAFLGLVVEVALLVLTQVYSFTRGAKAEQAA